MNIDLRQWPSEGIEDRIVFDGMSNGGRFVEKAVILDSRQITSCW